MRRLLVLAVALSSAVPFAACGDDGSDGDGAAGGQADTTLQVRPVLGRARDCQTPSANPTPNRPVSLALAQRCVGLAPAVLTVKRATVQEIPVNDQGVVAARVRLPPRDAAELAEVSEDFVGEEVGLVAFGRLLVAPVFAEPITDGVLEILGLSKAEIAALRTALAD